MNAELKASVQGLLTLHGVKMNLLASSSMTESGCLHQGCGTTPRMILSLSTAYLGWCGEEPFGIKFHD